ncbi:MAG: hypothetical protein JW902_00670 [Syntrophaceae bacterium]|nr:hypothetical protein [Syntrophaceae bacterium]
MRRISLPTAPFCSGDPKKAKVLVIGHDPRLQDSHTLAGYALFGDYYFKPVPTRKNELAKYQLAEAVYSYIGHLTSNKYSPTQIVLTNLCNDALPHAPQGKTVYIPEKKARQGIDEIREILNGSSIELIFAMSLQVNYWLQQLGFYPAVDEFLSSAKPKERGVTNKPPYYNPTRGRAFTLICGKQYQTTDQRIVVPILHVKNWLLRGSFAKAYAESMEACIKALK